MAMVWATVPGFCNVAAVTSRPVAISLTLLMPVRHKISGGMAESHSACRADSLSLAVINRDFAEVALGFEARECLPQRLERMHRVDNRS